MSKYITGFHSIEEKLRAAQKLQSVKNFKIFYSKPGPRVKKILASAKEVGIEASLVDDKTLDSMVSELSAALKDHRGIVMQMGGDASKGANLVDFDSWLKEHSDSNQKATVMILDRVTDPHNVGAIIRSCDQFGADLVVIPEHKSSNNIEENEVIGRTSAGASAWVPVAIVNNLVRITEQLKESGFWIYGADAGGETLGKIDFPARTVLIMGSEGQGMSQLLEKQCDTIVSIPTCGKIDSLNVSVAAGVLLYELYRRKSE